MAAIINQRDITLQASGTRLISDNILYREDKSQWVLRYNTILGEKTSIDNTADRYGFTSLKTTYDNAISALTSYLNTLTVPIAWNNYDNYTILSADSTGGTTLRTKFSDVDNAKAAIKNQEALLPAPVDGAPGAPGTRGSQTLYISGSVWSDAAADAATTGANVLGDTVTISDGGNFVSVKYWNGSAWVPPGIVLDGNLIVTGSVTAAKINTNGLTIRDASGNVILGTGFALDWTKLVASGQTGTTGITNSSITISSGALNGIGTGAGTTVANNAITISGSTLNGIGTGNGTAVANNAITIAANGVLSGAGGGTVTIGGLGYTGDLNATNGASIGGNLTGTFGIAQVAAYFAANSIGSTYIQDLAASKILAGTLAAGVVYAGTINANQISTSSLSAINANLGTITAGSININNKFIVDSSGNTTIQTGTSGQRTVMSAGLIQVYDSSNVLRVRLGIW